MKYRIQKETKPRLSTFGKYKAVAVHRSTVETDQIIREACEQNPLSEGVMTAAIIRLSEIVMRHLRAGDKVRLREFGLLKLEIESDKVDEPKDFKPKKHIRGVRLHFIPESEKGKPMLYKGIKYEKEKE
jgi:nucleoid DNA-binding protein